MLVSGEGPGGWSILAATVDAALVEGWFPRSHGEGLNRGHVSGNGERRTPDYQGLKGKRIDIGPGGRRALRLHRGACSVQVRG